MLHVGKLGGAWHGAVARKLAYNHAYHIFHRLQTSAFDADLTCGLDCAILYAKKQNDAPPLAVAKRAIVALVSASGDIANVCHVSDDGKPATSFDSSV